MLTEGNIFCQPSWVMQSNSVVMSITQSGAQMAPVDFDLPGNQRVQPYYISPWQREGYADFDGRSEGPLRGDFFCLPFGHAGPKDGVHPHGRSAGSRWSLSGYKSRGKVHELDIHMEKALRSANIRRQFFLVDDEAVVYDRTTVTDLEGAHTLGHHAVLRPPLRESALLLSTSRQVFGMTYPVAFADLAEEEHQSLAIGALFDDLSSVTSIFRDTADADCSVYPARRGFTDLLQVAVAADAGQPAWSAAVNTEENYLWFSLRDPGLLPSTILWFENAGRHRPPWSGRNVSIGVEDVCSFFDLGSEVSGEANAFTKRGIKTVHDFGNGLPLSIPYVQGVIQTPSGFGHVHCFSCGDSGVTFADEAGREVCGALRTHFVFGEEL